MLTPIKVTIWGDLVKYVTTTAACSLKAFPPSTAHSQTQWGKIHAWDQRLERLGKIVCQELQLITPLKQFAISNAQTQTYLNTLRHLITPNTKLFTNLHAKVAKLSTKHQPGIEPIKPLGQCQLPSIIPLWLLKELKGILRLEGTGREKNRTLHPSLHHRMTEEVYLERQMKEGGVDGCKNFMEEKRRVMPMYCQIGSVNFKWRAHTRIRLTESGQQGIKTGRSVFAVLGPLVNKTPTGNQSPKFWECSLFLWSVSGISCSGDTGSVMVLHNTGIRGRKEVLDPTLIIPDLVTEAGDAGARCILLGSNESLGGSLSILF